MTHDFLLVKFFESTHWTKSDVISYQQKDKKTIKLKTTYGIYIFEFTDTDHWRFEKIGA